MRFIIGFIVFLVGVLFASYFGVWCMFIGGIVEVMTGTAQIIKSVQENQIITTEIAFVIAIGIAKVVLAPIVGFLSIIFFSIPGIKIVKDEFFGDSHMKLNRKF